MLFEKLAGIMIEKKTCQVNFFFNDSTLCLSYPVHQR